jgi:TatD DNase family protein
MLTDTHAHLDFPDFAEDLPQVLARAAAAGVHRVITIGTTLAGSQRAIDLASAHGMVWATVGVHPSSAEEAPEDVLNPLRELAKHQRVVAIGECGLDYHRLPSRSFHEAAVATAALGNETPAAVEASVLDAAIKDKQASIFEQQLDLAVELNLPVVIHERDAWEDTLEILAPYTGKVRAVFHCFGKSPEAARQVLEMNHLVSFTGIVTFKNAGSVRETATTVPTGRFMVETDCPFLSPVPFRGKRCEPAYTVHTAAHIASLRGVSPEQIAAETERTADEFFRFASRTS